jgi:hypothetical protein
MMLIILIGVISMINLNTIVLHDGNPIVLGLHSVSIGTMRSHRRAKSCASLLHPSSKSNWIANLSIFLPEILLVSTGCIVCFLLLLMSYSYIPLLLIRPDLSIVMFCCVYRVAICMLAVSWLRSSGYLINVTYVVVVNRLFLIINRLLIIMYYFVSMYIYKYKVHNNARQREESMFIWFKQPYSNFGGP